VGSLHTLCPRRRDDSSPKPSSTRSGPIPTSCLNAYPKIRPLLGADLTPTASPHPNPTGNRTYTPAHFLSYAGVVTPETHR
jgi:hypothetical protein